MSKFVVDVEAAGQCPGVYSMISFGAVALHDLDQTFYSGIMRPLPNAEFDQGAMDVTGTKVEDMMTGRSISEVMHEFRDWVNQMNSGGRAMFFSDNNGFDWQFINYYFHYAVGENPFGHSSTNINSLYKGMTKDMRKNIKRLRKTRHTHHPVDDAMGNAEALLEMKRRGLDIML